MDSILFIKQTYAVHSFLSVDGFKARRNIERNRWFMMSYDEIFSSCTLFVMGDFLRHYIYDSDAFLEK